MAVFRSTIVWRDRKGFIAKTAFYSNAATLAAAAASAQAVAVALGNASNCAIQAFHGPGEQGVTGIIRGTAGQYQNGSTKALLTFSAGGGSLIRHELPAPLSGLFYADLETINNEPGEPFNAVVTAMTDGVTCSRVGEVLTGFVGGRLVRRPMPRRLSSILLKPDLNGPAW